MQSKCAIFAVFTAGSIALNLAFLSSAYADQNKVRVGAVAADARGFAPQGWHVAYSPKGDLNGDGAADIVVVLQEDYKGSASTDFDETPQDFNPYNTIVVIALRDEASDNYIVDAVNNALVSPRASFAMAPALADESAVQISKGVLSIRMDLFFSMGSWSSGKGFLNSAMKRIN